MTEATKRKANPDKVLTIQLNTRRISRARRAVGSIISQSLNLANIYLIRPENNPWILTDML